MYKNKDFSPTVKMSHYPDCCHCTFDGSIHTPHEDNDDAAAILKPQGIVKDHRYFFFQINMTLNIPLP